VTGRAGATTLGARAMMGGYLLSFGRAGAMMGGQVGAMATRHMGEVA
jgi:hypothetical protein